MLNQGGESSQDYHHNDIVDHYGRKSKLDLNIRAQVIVNEGDLHPCIVNFLSTDEPLVLLRVERIEAWCSLHVHGGDSQVRHRVERMTLEDLLHVSGLAEVKHAKENLLFLLKVLVDAALLHERVHSLCVLRLHNLAMLAIGLDVEYHHNIIWPWVLQHILFIIGWREHDDIICGPCLHLFHLRKLLLPQLLNLDILLLRLGRGLAHTHCLLLLTESTDSKGPLEIQGH